MVGFDLQLLLAGKLLLLMVVGIAARKLKIIADGGKNVLTDLVIYLLLPCSILNSFISEDGPGKAGQVGQIFAVSILIQAVAVGLSLVLYRKCAPEHIKPLRYATIVPNSGILGTAVADGIFGPVGALLASIYLIPMRLCMWTVGFSCFTKANHGNTLRKAVSHPCILSALAGFAIMMLRIPVPALISQTISSIGSSNTAISMILVGSIIADMDLSMLKHFDVAYFTVLRLLFIPLLVYGICTGLGLDETVRNVCVVLTAMPAGSTAPILALKYGGNEYFASAIVAVTTVLSIIALPLWCAFLGRF